MRLRTCERRKDVYFGIPQGDGISAVAESGTSPRRFKIFSQRRIRIWNDNSRGKYNTPRKIIIDVLEFKVLSGQQPFWELQRKTIILVAIVIQKKRPVLPPATSLIRSSYAKLWSAAERAWAEEPDDRPTITALLPELKDAVAKQPTVHPVDEIGIAVSTDGAHFPPSPSSSLPSTKGLETHQPELAAGRNDPKLSESHPPSLPSLDVLHPGHLDSIVPNHHTSSSTERDQGHRLENIPIPAFLRHDGAVSPITSLLLSESC